MNYFDDMRFINGGVVPRCQAAIDQRFTETYSVEFLLAGRMYYGIDGGNRIILDRPTVFWHHPRHSYQYGSLDKRGWDQHWIMVSGSRARRMIEDGLMPLSATQYLPVLEPLVLAEEFRALVALIQQHDPCRHPETVVRLEHIVAQLIEWRTRTTVPTPYHGGIELLARHLRKDPCRTYDFQVEAARLGLSYSHFRREFRRHIGRAPYDFLLACRMRRAAVALQNTVRQVKEIAADAGYDDMPQFSKLFKKKIGVAPRYYRELIPPTSSAVSINETSNISASGN
ncbi:MAG: AraC family transcriptional regulator [Verrucomicrobia bacterium]|nr:AraC family transcriptional regulator [Verrucomicrobiota bacterium]MCG2681003.1 AraC family transcriptional regulator [Kiritimatiellia bacterium]MBU4247783.1 AraC family transcriptional regulator [Verrucomicrobiota bacterium]MBU4292071.1 AraC family transcriptional regulator [Verrucomicrobiota bacterium]MBU4427856.1 AraC family transcriptional regulator [Verrucomicrobiota bacterium]